MTNDPDMSSAAHRPHNSSLLPAALSEHSLSTGTLPADRLFELYNGNGRTANGSPVQNRDNERGHYLASEHVTSAVRTAIAVERPLLVTGEPGTGKTALAWSIASELELGSVLCFHTRSDSQARDLLYQFDHIRRFYDAQNSNSESREPKNYRSLRALGEAISSSTRCVVLIDEIDKAPRDFPNDLLDEIDHMAFEIPDTKESYQASFRPIVVITSNNERQLPEAFLRRCVFCTIPLPSKADLLKILELRMGSGHLDIIDAACDAFLTLREQQGFKKLPATGELLVWMKRLSLDRTMKAERLYTSLRKLPFVEILLKFREDLQLLDKLEQQVRLHS